jgi:hypothetical protein
MMSALAVGSLIATTGASASAAPHAPRAITGFGTVVVTPAKELKDNQVVTVKASKFPGATTLYAAECSSTAVKKVSEDYCDTTPAHLAVIPAKNGGATFKFTIHTGADFTPTNTTGVPCTYPNSCNLIVSDGATLATTTTVAFPTITFAGVKTKTAVKPAKKTIKVKKSVTFKVTTTHSKSTSKPTGKVTIFDNGKKIATKKEPASGKFSWTHKFKKAGKQHIKVTYSGDKVFEPSSGFSVITVKK